LEPVQIILEPTIKGILLNTTIWLAPAAPVSKLCARFEQVGSNLLRYEESTLLGIHRSHVFEVAEL
jgi:hypothetical protein